MCVDPLAVTRSVLTRNVVRKLKMAPRSSANVLLQKCCPSVKLETEEEEEGEDVFY